MELDRILLSVHEAFLEHPDQFRPSGAILRLLALTLYNNDFEFDGQFWSAPTFVSKRSKFHPNWFNFGGVIAKRVKTANIQYSAEAYLQAE